MSNENYAYDNSSLADLTVGLRSFLRRDSNPSKYYTYRVTQAFGGLPEGKEQNYSRYVAEKNGAFRNGSPIEQTSDPSKYTANLEVNKVDTYQEAVNNYSRMFNGGVSRRSRRVGGGLQSSRATVVGWFDGTGDHH